MVNQVDDSGDTRTALQRYPFFILWGLSLIGYWAILPYVSHLGLIPSSESFFSFALFGSIQIAITNAILLLLGYLLLQQVDLTPFHVNNWLKDVILPGLAVGLVLGFGLYYLDRALFSAFRPLEMPPYWIGALSALYGAINEEIFGRVFLLPLFLWVLQWIFRKGEWPKERLIMGAILLSAIVFAFNQLPAGVSLGLVSFLGIFRILLVNVIAGAAFGWLFCWYSFWAASLAHLVMSLILNQL